MSAKSGLEDRLYEETAAQLDNVTLNIVSILLTAFIVSQRFISPENTMPFIEWAMIFAVFTLALHYISFITAYLTQVAKIKEESKGTRKKSKVFYTKSTRIINGLVRFFVIIMFAISIAIITHSGG